VLVQRVIVKQRCNGASKRIERAACRKPELQAALVFVGVGYDEDFRALVFKPKLHNERRARVHETK